MGMISRSKKRGFYDLAINALIFMKKNLRKFIHKLKMNICHYKDNF